MAGSISKLVVRHGSGVLKALEPRQLHDLAYSSLRIHSRGYGASLLFFGFCCVLFGHLIHRSGYLPRIAGILLATGGYGYVVFSVGQLPAPELAGRYMFTPVFVFAFVAETTLALWLLVKGVDASKWQETIGRHAEAGPNRGDAVQASGTVGGRCRRSGSLRCRPTVGQAGEYESDGGPREDRA